MDIFEVESRQALWSALLEFLGEKFKQSSFAYFRLVGQAKMMMTMMFQCISHVILLKK